MKAPERLETTRLVLRRPSPGDAHAIFTRYASDADVTRYLAWPRHESIESTRSFLGFSDLEWASWPAGPYLIESRAAGTLLGSTGLGFETPEQAGTGYVLARDAWGNGYATEALFALLKLCASLGVRRVHALVHLEHATFAACAREMRLRARTGVPGVHAVPESGHDGSATNGPLRKDFLTIDRARAGP